MNKTRKTDSGHHKALDKPTGKFSMPLVGKKTNRARFFQTMLEPMAALTPMYLATALQCLFGKPGIFKPDVSLLWMVPRLPTIKTIVLHEYGVATLLSAIFYHLCTHFPMSLAQRDIVNVFCA